MNAPPEAGSTRWRVIVPFAAVTLIWSSTWLVIRDQLGVVPPSWSVAYRFLIAGLVLIAVAVARRDRLWLPASGFVFATALGLAQFVLNFNLVYRAEAHITSGLVALIFAFLIVPNAVLGRIFLKQQLSWTFLIASLVAIAGVALMFVHEARMDTSGSSDTVSGIVLTLAAVMCASVANVMQGAERAGRYAMVPMIGWAMLIGAGLDAACAWATVGPPVMEWRAGYIAGVLYLGIIASSLAFVLYYNLIRAIGPAMAAYSSVIIPVIAMLLSTMFEGYRWSTLSAFGGALAMVGLVIALRARRPVR